MIGNLSLYDNLVLLLYFSIVMVIGIYSAIGKDKTAKDYFLAGRDMGWLAIGMSLFATNISAEHLVGLAGSASIHGLSVGYFEWFAVLILFLLGWVFAPILIKSNVYTMPEFFGKRFDGRTRTYLTILSLAVYFFTKIGVTLLAAGFILSRIIGLDMFFASILVVLLTGIYTVIGGLNSVIKTQIFQAVVLILGAFFLTVFGLKEIGGLSVLTSTLPQKYFAVFKSFSDPDLPWTGILLGAPILGIWYWCTDQYIMQRIFSSRSVNDAKKGTALAAVLKTLPILLFIIPGMIAVEIFPTVSGDEVYPYLLGSNILPSGVKGIVFAGLFAALMSSLSSAFNSASTLIANDLYKVRNKNSTDHELVLIGRLSTVMIVFLTIVLIPLIRMINTQIYIYLQHIQAFISPPIAAVFLLGIFWSKATSKGAFLTLIIGGIIGLVRVILIFAGDFIIPESIILNLINQLNYLHFAVMLFIISMGLMIVISLYDTKDEIEIDKPKEIIYPKEEVKFSFNAEKIDDYEIINQNKQTLNA